MKREVPAGIDAGRLVLHALSLARGTGLHAPAVEVAMQTTWMLILPCTMT